MTELWTSLSVSLTGFLGGYIVGAIACKFPTPHFLKKDHKNG